MRKLFFHSIFVIRTGFRYCPLFLILTCIGASDRAMIARFDCFCYNAINRTRVKAEDGYNFKCKSIFSPLDAYKFSRSRKQEQTKTKVTTNRYKKETKNSSNKVRMKIFAVKDSIENSLNHCC